jgi:hypothetical protein
MAVSLVTFTLSPERYVSPTLEAVCAGELAALIARVRAGSEPRFEWPWRASTASEPHDDPARWDPAQWLAEHTRADALSVDVSPPLAQCVTWDEGALVGRYLFDHEYALAHPEALDRTHLALAHGTIAAKMFDEGALVLTDDGVRASLRWRSVRAKGTRLGPGGTKHKTSRAPR